MSLAFTALEIAHPPALPMGYADVLFLRARLKSGPYVRPYCAALVLLSERRTDRLALRRIAAEYDSVHAEVVRCRKEDLVSRLIDPEAGCTHVLWAISMDAFVMGMDFQSLPSRVVRGQDGPLGPGPLAQIAVIEEPGMPQSVEGIDGVLLAPGEDFMRGARCALHATAAAVLAPERLVDHEWGGPGEAPAFGSWSNPAVVKTALWRPDTRELIWKTSEDRGLLAAFVHVQVFVEAPSPHMALAGQLLREIFPEHLYEHLGGRPAWWIELAPGMLLSPGLDLPWAWPVWMICRP